MRDLNGSSSSNSINQSTLEYPYAKDSVFLKAFRFARYKLHGSMIFLFGNGREARKCEEYAAMLRRDRKELEEKYGSNNITIGFSTNNYLSTSFIRHDGLVGRAFKRVKALWE